MALRFVTGLRTLRSAAAIFLRVCFACHGQRSLWSGHAALQHVSRSQYRPPWHLGQFATAPGAPQFSHSEGGGASRKSSRCR